MILHFSHIGLTDGLTFMIPFGDWVPAARLWLPFRPPLPRRGEALVRVRNRRLRAELPMLATPMPPQRAPGPPAGRATARWAAGSASGAPAPLGASQPGRASSSGARSGVAAEARRQGVNTRGPAPVIATVYSKCAAGEPSWEK